MDSKKENERLTNLLKTAQEEFSEEYFIFAIPSFLSKKFIAYCSMKEDLELIIQYINLLKIETNKIIKSSLTYSLISVYGKCFTDASKNSYPKLETNIFQNNSTFLTTHEYLMDLRHQFIAHRGKTESEIGIAYVIIPKEKDKDDKTQIRFSQVKQNSFSPQDLISFENIVNYLIQSLIEKIQKSGQKLYDAYLKIYDPKTISNMVFNNAK